MTTFNLPTIITTTGGTTTSPFTAIASTNFVVTAGNWGGTTPSNLANVLDGDLTTATGWGQTAGGGNKGWVQVDLGQAYTNLFFRCKFGYRMGDGWGGGEASWTIDLADEAGNFSPLWTAYKFRPGVVEFIVQPGFWVRGQKVRFTGEDTGNGPAILRVYDFRAWSVTLP